MSGLYYETATQAGQTNAQGEFRYRSGETVRFYVGEILIGEVAGAAILSPFDLAGMTPPTSQSDIYRVVHQMMNQSRAIPLDRVINIAMFLQTIDENGDTSDGIQIPAEMHNLAVGVTLDFDQSIYGFERGFALHSLLAAGRSAGLWGGSRAIVNFAYSLDHLYDGMGLTPSILKTIA